jgi:hypothetical protein
MKEQDIVKMEFLISLNNNIVIQRYFNVRGYNPKARVSIELYEYLRDFVDSFEQTQKMRTVVYMMDNQYDITEDPNILETNNTDGPENFNFYIKIGDQTICQRQLDAKIFPPKIRYTVDIRQEAKSVLRQLTDIFSGQNFNTNYLNYTLAQ